MFNGKIHYFYGHGFNSYFDITRGKTSDRHRCWVDPDGAPLSTRAPVAFRGPSSPRHTALAVTSPRGCLRYAATQRGLKHGNHGKGGHGPKLKETKKNVDAPSATCRNSLVDIGCLGFGIPTQVPPLQGRKTTPWPRCPRSANLYSPGRRNQTTAPAAILPTPTSGVKKHQKIAKDNMQFSSSSIFVASVSSSASPLVIDDDVNKYENKRAFANLAGPVAHWMRRCVFDAESSINIALEVRFLPGPLCLISLPFVAVMFLRYASHWGTEFVWRKKKPSPAFQAGYTVIHLTGGYSTNDWLSGL